VQNGLSCFLPNNTLQAAMNPITRREFISASVCGLASALVSGDTSRASFIGPTQFPNLEILPTNLTPRDTIFLTWLRDPTTTVTVQWIGPEKSDTSTVRCVPRTGDVWQTGKTVLKPWPRSDLKVHRCELTKLRPDTEYLLQVGRGPETYRFRTMPAKATNTFQWVSGGDCGTNAHAITTNILAAKQEPYFALIGGDLGYDNGTSARTALQFIQNYSRHMIDPKGRLIPMLACLGNHEVRGGYKGKRADATYFLPLFDGLYPETTYATLDFGDYLSVVLLDSGHVAPIGGDQTDWLESTLAEREGRPHLIVANHVPAYPSVRRPEGLFGMFGTGEANRLHWCPLFEKYGVDAVLEHHDHAFKRTHPLKNGVKDQYGVPYLGDGSWGRLRTPTPPEKRPYLATVAKAYHLSVHRLEGDQRFHIALEGSGKIADVFTTTGKRPAKRG
jgi:hypothetical protein